MHTFRLLFSACLFISLPVSAASISPGDLIISEVMANPSGSDYYGEWFELHNLTGNSLDLDGLVLSDNGSDQHAIENLVIEPFGYLVLGRNGDSNLNGGYTADYVYTDFVLTNSDDEVIISNAGVEIVRLEYTTGFAAAGKSMELAGIVGFSLDNSNYTQSTSVYGLGDYGTPGRPGDSSWTVSVQPVPVPATIWLFGTGLMWLFGVTKKRPAVSAGLSSS